MTLGEVRTAAGNQGLLVMGAFHPRTENSDHPNDGTMILLGAGPDFWTRFTASDEACDGQPDAIDRWSSRVVSALGAKFGAAALFPFGGPPYAPFINWAQQSGRAHTSPTGMLVHDAAGLMISYRGALHFPDELALPASASAAPCPDCAGQPCAMACPVGALRATGPYDVAACHAYLDTAAGQDCMINGCVARRACPLSAGAARSSAQSAYHMKAFHPS